MYLATRLYCDRLYGLDGIFNTWQKLAQDIEPFGPATWRTWRSTQVISENDNQTRLYRLDGRWWPLGLPVMKASSCYLRGEQINGGTAFTILSSEEEALHSVRALIENIYAPARPASLGDFLERNRALPVQAARIYDSTTGDQIIFTYGHKRNLGDLLDQGFSIDREAPTRLLSFSATVADTALPLKVRLVYVSGMAHEVGFSVENTAEEDDAFVDKLFTLTDMAFRGDILTHAGS